MNTGYFKNFRKCLNIWEKVSNCVSQLTSSQEPSLRLMVPHWEAWQQSDQHRRSSGHHPLPSAMAQLHRVILTG